jgi:hypothetical protein
MALTATFDADFSSFVTAAKTSSAALTDLKGTANTTGKMLDAMAATATQTAAPALDEFGSATAAAGMKGNEFKTAFNQVDKTLASVGVSLGPLPGMLDELTSAAGKSVTELGLLGTAGVVVAAAVGGWKIGQKIDEWTGWSTAIANNTAALMGWGNVAAETAIAKADTLARASSLAGRDITDMAVAVRILQDAAAAASTEQAKLAADIKLSEAAAEKFLDFTGRLFSYDDIDRAELYMRALGGIENVTKLTTDKKKELHTAVTAAIDAYKALGTAAPADLLAIQRATTELITVTESFSAVSSGMWTQYAAGAEDGVARMAAITENAKLGWEEIGGVSRAMLEQIARDAEEKYAVAQAHADHFTGEQIANFRRAAAEARAAVDDWGTATLEAYDAIQEASVETATVQIAESQRAATATITSWHEAMSAVAAGQGTMGGTVGGAVDTSPAARASMQKAWEEGRYFGPVVNVSEANPRGTGPDFRALGYRASGGPVSAGQPYMVGERGPELFVPTAAGNIRPHGAGGITLNNTFHITGGTETLARQVSAEIMRTIRAGTQLGTA